MLQIESLNLRVNKKVLLKNINIDFLQGIVYGIIGPNGVGKTTLFKSILGITAYSGTVQINGNPVNDSKIGKLIEYPSFYKGLTVKQNLQLYAKYIGSNPENIYDVLKKVDLMNSINVRFENLSLGTKQRLGIARSLLGNNDILLLDEPQNGLDPLGIKSVRDLLNNPSIRNNKIILLASHNLNEISKIADRIVFVNHGEILCRIVNKPSAIYYVYSYGGNLKSTSEWQISNVGNTNYILSSLDPEKVDKQFPNDVSYVGKIQSLESLFDFVITGRMDNYVNAN